MNGSRVFGCVVIAVVACGLIGLAGCKSKASKTSKPTPAASTAPVVPMLPVVQQPVAPAPAQANDNTAVLSTTQLKSLESKWRTEWSKMKSTGTGTAARLTWPTAIPASVTTAWAKSAKVYGKTKAEIQTKYGKPTRVVLAKNQELMVYKTSSYAVSQGKCIGKAPSSPNYEKYFAQTEATSIAMPAKTTASPNATLTKAK